MNFYKKPLACLISLALFSPVTFAENQSESEKVERITVKGALVSTPLSEMAASISVLTEEAIQQRQAQHLEALLNRASNVNFSTGASRGRFVQIRGIGERSQFTDPVNPSVGYLVDGISYSGIMAGASMFDLEQVEIFKGPNSARFGAEGLAGMINVVTKEASDDTSVNLQLGAANYGSYNVGAALGGALSDSVAARVSIHKNESNGFMENLHLGRDDTNGIDELTGRFKLSWQATDDLLLKTTLHLIDVDNGYDAFSLNLDRTTLSDEPGFDRQQSEALALNALYSGLEMGNLEVQASTLNADIDYGYDEDWSYVGIAPGWEYSSTDHYLRERDDQELQFKLTSKPNAKSAWALGTYYSNELEDLERNYFDFDRWQEDSFYSTFERRDLAVFGQYQYFLSDEKWITSSLRLATQEFDYNDSSDLVSNIDHTDWGGEVSYHQQVSDETMLYLSLVRSYKAPGVNGRALSKVSDIEEPALQQELINSAEFDAESLIGLEFGIKGANPEGTLTLDFAAFYQDRQDAQFKNYIVQGLSYVGFINNAASGVNYGIEASLGYFPSDNFEVFANLGYLETEIKGFTRQDGSTIDNRDQAHAPNYQVNVGSVYHFNDKLSWLFEVDAKDEFYYSFTHDDRSEKVVLAHTSLNYVKGDWKVSIYARNLFDRLYANRGFSFGNDPRDEYAPHVYEQFGEPRRVGIQVSYNY